MRNTSPAFDEKERVATTPRSLMAAMGKFVPVEMQWSTAVSIVEMTKGVASVGYMRA